MAAWIVAIVGAESTGKTWLAQALTEHLRSALQRDAVCIPEHLRAWCEAKGRTPLKDEQAGIAQAQREAIEQAGSRHEVVVCDTTPLMTAVYSHHIFGDDSLKASALAWQAQVQHTLLTRLDLPWQADGIQRDGPHVRAPVDRTLRLWMQTNGVAWSEVAGLGPQRLDAALQALEPMLSRGKIPMAHRSGSRPSVDGT